MPSDLLVYLRIALAIQGNLWFHMNFRIVFSVSVKTAIESLIGIALHPQMALDSTEILVLVFPIHECVVSLHLFVSSSLSSMT